MKIEHVGLHQNRFQNNPAEKAISDLWTKENENGRILEWLLCQEKGRIARDLTQEEATTAATVIQWLGTIVGRSFLVDAIKSNEDLERYIKYYL